MTAETFAFLFLGSLVLLVACALAWALERAGVR